METAVRRFTLIFSVLAIVASARVARAHGVVGDYIFLEPLVAEDPTPANELDIVQPQWTRTAQGRTFSIGSAIEKVLGTDSEGLPRFSVGGDTSWIYQSPKEGPNEEGFGNLGLFAKYAFLIIPEHEFLM